MSPDAKPVVQTRTTRVSLRPIENPDLRLRPIGYQDAEALRVWKNARRHVFFHQNEITAPEQESWIVSYLQRPEDFMYVVELKDERIGCMGFRLVAGAVDVYNIILGRPEHGGQGHMSIALRTLCEYASRFSSRITVKVLKTNPARSWYEKNGFILKSDESDHVLLKLDRSRFRPSEFNEEDV